MKKVSVRIIIGAAVIIVGVTMLLNNMGIANLNPILHTWWPLVLVIAGIIIFINNPRGYLLGFVLVLLGSLWQLQKLDLIQFSPWQIAWPVIVIAIGVSITANRKDWGAVTVHKDERHDVTAILAGSDVKSRSPNFKGSTVTAIMGGAKLDLRDATIRKKATIEVSVFWGGIEIYVPKGTLVKSQTNNILGSTEDKAIAPETSNSPELCIVGDVIMGGVEIKN